MQKSGWLDGLTTARRAQASLENNGGQISVSTSRFALTGILCPSNRRRRYGQVPHGSATRTEAVRRAIQHSQDSLRALANARDQSEDRCQCGSGPRWPICRLAQESRDRRCSRPRRRLSWSPSGATHCCRSDDCLYALQPTIPHLTRSSLHRRLQRHGIGRLPDVKATSRRGGQGAHRTGQAAHVRCHRSHLEVRLRGTGTRRTPPPPRETSCCA